MLLKFKDLKVGDLFSLSDFYKDSTDYKNRYIGIKLNLENKYCVFILNHPYEIYRHIIDHSVEDHRPVELIKSNFHILQNTEKAGNSSIEPSLPSTFSPDYFSSL